MKKLYDSNGDVILTQDQKELCRLANFLYDAVDRLFILEDEKDIDLHPAVLVYQDALQKLEKLVDLE